MPYSYALVLQVVLLLVLLCCCITSSAAHCLAECLLALRHYYNQSRITYSVRHSRRNTLSCRDVKSEPY
jgi:hypothetical protein